MIAIDRSACRRPDKQSFANKSEAKRWLRKRSLQHTLSPYTCAGCGRVHVGHSDADERSKVRSYPSPVFGLVSR